MVKSTRARLVGFAALSLLLGIGLRFAYPSDMEYKYDEMYMYSHSQAIGATEPWPAVGMHSGVGLVNPGLSVWIFAALAKLASSVGADSPVGLACSVIFLNCLGLLVLAYVVFRVVEPPEREAWVWGLALLAVSPFMIQIQRKIWAQSTLPIFSAFFFWAWLKRQSRWGAFAWGFLGAILGQIHMSGFFFAAAFFLATVWSSLRGGQGNKKKIPWLAWVAGSGIGAIPLVPWVLYVHAHPGVKAIQGWGELLNLRFWSEWAKQIVGMSVRYTLGADDFSRYIHNYLTGAAVLISVVSGAAILLLGLRGRAKDRGGDTELAQNTALWGFGGLLTVMRVYVERHYLIVAYPLQFIWIARLALKRENLGRRLLVALWVAQLVMSVAFLRYIHVNGGAGGDYGKAYSAQKH